jgi:hypothetical protein
MREGTGVAAGVAGTVTAFFVALGALLATTTYLFICVYAIVKWIGDADGHPDPATIIVGWVAISSLLVLGLMLGVRLVGRSLVERRRNDRAS